MTLTALPLKSESTLADCAERDIPAVSAEIFTIPLDHGRYLVYAPLRRAAFVGNARVVNTLADIAEGRFDPASEPDAALLAFLRCLEIVDAGAETAPITVFEGTPEPTHVSLLLTTACNLRCTYCYASAGDTKLEVMPLEVATRGIDYVAANARKQNLSQFQITYHGGGEPTLNWRVITQSYDYAQQRAEELGLTVNASCATNGVIPDSKIDWILANLSGVCVSFDGLPSVQDKHRPKANGTGSSERVMHTIRRFDAAQYPYALRMTVTHDQIAMLPDLVEFICANFHPRRIQVEPAYQMGRWQSAPSAETAEFIAAYREAQARAMSYGQEIIYSAARTEVLTNHFCGITQDSFCLTPSGNVTACYETFSEQTEWSSSFFYGRPEKEGKGYLYNLPVLNNLRSQAVQHRRHCDGCFARWHCAGDCYHKSLHVNGEGEFAGTDRCHITRELTKDQILSPHRGFRRYLLA